MGKKQQPQQVTVPNFAFVGGDDSPLALGNVFVVAQLGEEFIIVVGQASPVLAGTVQDGSVVAQQGQTLPIRTVAQFVVTETRMQELINNLQGSLDNAKRVKEQGA